LLVLSPGVAAAGPSTSLYGDGSAGHLTVSSTGTLGVDVAADSNFQFRNFTVAPGVTLTVASGTVIRCKGAFTNDGTIVVSPGDHGGIAHGGARAPAGQGVAHRPAGHGAVGDVESNTLGGEAAPGLEAPEARSLRHVGPSAGGGGGSSGIFGAGGRGGGSLTVLAAKGVTNAGAIHADAEYAPGLISPGDGGGAGGVILLASRTFVTNQGTISARGSDGEDGSLAPGPVHAGGGGGGGGIVHFLGPNVAAGQVDVSGGLGGSGTAESPASLRSGGGAGGACGGDGGQGGSVAPGASPGGAGQLGDPGHVLQTLADPTSSF
jgi:hypothetical protein